MSDKHPVDLRGAMLLDVDDGLIVRRTDYWDSLTVLRQTGKA
jgi:ketosteroid isomerase-like protein